MNKKYSGILFVESPSKIYVYKNAIKGSKYENIKIMSTKGHLREVVIKKFNINDNKPNIEWKDKIHVKSIIKQLSELQFNNEKDLIISTDSDREGEGIGWHLIELIKKHFKYTKTPYRVNCIELIKEKIIEEIDNTFNNNKTLNYFLINAYKTRIIIDLVIGIYGSKILWRSIYGCSSLGRVQSISIITIFILEQKIREFLPEKYYKLQINIHNNKEVFINKIYEGNKLVNEIKDVDKTNIIKKELEEQQFYYVQQKVFYTKSEKIQPLDMSSLSACTNSKLDMKINKMYSICQKLYEGIQFKGETIGSITYMRTDSKYISEKFILKIQNHIKNIFGEKEYAPHIFKEEKNNTTQEAHEAIRPTFLLNDKEYEDFVKVLERREKKVYEYIMYRTLASFMHPVTYKHTELQFVSQNGKYSFTIPLITVENAGYLQLIEYYNCNFCYTKINNPNEEKVLQKIIDTKEAIKVKVTINENCTKAPERLTESKLIQELKKNNIGRPSTYGYIVETIKNREYVQMINNKYYITGSGLLLSIFILQYLTRFINYTFTASMEEKLDQIAGQKENFKEVIEQFINTFNKETTIVNDTDRKIILNKIEEYLLQNYINKCIKCDNNLSLRFMQSKPYICCTCGYYQSINKIGYKDQKNIPINTEYSKNNQYINNIRKNNYYYNKKYYKSYNNNKK